MSSLVMNGSGLMVSLSSGYLDISDLWLVLRDLNITTSWLGVMRLLHVEWLLDVARRIYWLLMLLDVARRIYWLLMLLDIARSI